MKLNKPSQYLIMLLTGAFVFRLALSFFGTLQLDMNAWMGWANRLATVPLGQFYDQWSDYLPGYLYVLWVLGKVSQVIGSSDMLFKLPAIMADIATGALIYWIILRLAGKGKESLALLGAGLYLFNPAVWANSTLWGQVDGLTGFFLMASLALFLSTRSTLAIGLLGLGLVVKPQIAFLWFIFAAVLIRQRNWRSLVLGTFVSGLVALLTFIPFSGGNALIPFVFGRLSQSFNQYPYSSLNAFNFWGLTGGAGWWLKDSGPIPVLGWPIQTVGFLLGGALILLAGLKVFRRSEPVTILLAAALTQLAAFFFFTRVHERHLLPVLAPLTAAFVATGAIDLGLALVLCSLSYVFNLAFAFVWITDNFRQIIPAGGIAIGSLANGLSLVLVARMLLVKQALFGNRWVGWVLRMFRAVDHQEESAADMLPVSPGVRRKWVVLLGGILLFSLLTRMYGLSVPSSHMFDEVYHAFTAQEMLKGNKAAWEWWNSPPAGFAYEWSHPPLAKEFMVAGLKIIGDEPIGWRIPGVIVGTLTVLMVFLIAEELFGNRTLSVVAALVFSLDTLPLVMSRIGMNDSYFLFFLLAAVWFLLRENFLLMGLTFGLSLASKWTAIYFLVLIGFYWLTKKLWRSPKKTVLLFLAVVVLVPAVYLFSYLPFFTWGHGWDKFLELQKQMWWYHTGLKATHAYQSQAWSWPIMLRPVWLYVNYGNNEIANVYAQGNPLLYWFALPASLVALYAGFKARSWSLRMTVFAYGLFFIPWLFSPRIMFLYHFLPSTPFLAIIVAWFLLVLWKAQGRKAVLISLVVFAAGFLFFYPHLTAWAIPSSLDPIFYWLPSWK